MNEQKPCITPTPLIAGLVGGVFALIGMLRMPYPFYGTMRIVVTIACVVLAVGAFARRKPIASAPLVVMAIFFFFVKGLSKELWTMIDLTAAVCLIVIGAWLSRQPVLD